MQMDTLHCGYHPGAGLGVGSHRGGVPITPPATPTNDIARTPEYSSCEEQYAHHRYAPTDYHSTHYVAQDNHNPYTSVAAGFSPPESPQATPKTTPAHSPMHLSTPIAHIENNNSSSYSIRSNRKSSTGSNKGSCRNRKNSYVYDVRLPDEQFLFLVPDLDLVKSHLMFAVREEVEVLKEKITELMERINQLEYENTVLKQYATSEALQQIQQHHNSNT